ncbi:MAG TPA: response regulator [Acidimicrobiales bacterium]|nr:response regulator [Acidimicrobiales bacterium]
MSDAVAMTAGIGDDAAVPDAEVTFLFTDIEGSTRLLQRQADSYGRLLNEHRRLLRAAFAAHGGDELGTEGDSFFVAFDDAAGAVAGALAAQQALARHSWPENGAVRVRMGIHRGPVSVTGGQYVGLAVHQAARVCSAGHGGQVLLSATCEAAVRGSLPVKAKLASLGSHPLKDFDEPEEIFQLCHPDLVRDLPPLRTSGELPVAMANDGAAGLARDRAVRVLLVDDQEMVRAGFRMILEARDIEVAGEAADGALAIDAIARLRPDVVLMDIRMPNLDGIEATRKIMAAPAPHPKVLILTTFDLDEYVFEALRAGASGFLLKDAAPDDLVHAVSVVARGEALLAPSVTRRLIEEFGAGSRAAPVSPALTKAIDALTTRELEVLRLVARGMSNAEIGERLFVGEATVKTHVSNVLMKLGCRDRVQAVVVAYEAGVVQPGGAD